MPHQPRRYASSLGVAPELQQSPKLVHKAMPLPEEKQDAASARRRLGIETINMQTYEPDFKQVCKSMFGDTVTFDEKTGEMHLQRKKA